MHVGTAEETPEGGLIPTTPGPMDPVSVLLVLLGPICLALALLLTYAADQWVFLGPIARSQIGIIVLPLVLVSPGLCAAASRFSGSRRTAGYVVGGTSVALAVVFTVAVLLLGRGTSCSPITGPQDVAGPALLIGLAAGATFGISGTVAALVVQESLRRAITFGAVTVAALGGGVVLLFAVLFPASSCVWAG